MSTRHSQPPVVRSHLRCINHQPARAEPERAVEAADGRVVLKGNVSTFFQKQMAQEAVRRIDGVQQIENLLQVNWA